MSTIVSTSTATGSSGTIYMTGLSDIDTSALIEAAVEAKMAPAYRLDTQIDELDAEVAGWEEMVSLLEDLTAATAALSSDEDESVYDSYTSYLSSSGVDDPTDYLGSTVDSDTVSAGIYEIIVEQLATTQKVASSEMAADTELSLSGTITLAADGYDGVDIEIDEDMTLDDIADAINAVADDTGVTATLVKTSDGKQTLILASSDTGTTFTATDSSGSALEDLGVIDSSGDFADLLQSAQNAVLTIDGVSVNSSSNDIEDIVPGLSISLYGATDGESITLEVGQDLSKVLDSVDAFVEAYNAYRTFALEQQETDDSGATDDAVLFGESLLHNATSSLYSLINTSVEVDGESYTLASFGITVGAGNMLEIDEDVLEEALVQNPEVLQAFFQSSGSTDSVDLGVTSLPTSVASGDYELVVTMADDGSIASATLDGVAMEISGHAIIGPDGSDFEDMRLVYTGDEDATLTVTVSQGMADSLVSTMETYTDDLLADKIESLEGVIDDKQDRRDAIADSAADYEDYLIDYYADLEAKIVEAETLLAQLDALMGNSSD
ncbi:MAG: flagellar filament capping protein FliD [Rhodospirillum sp.]|nr:flagellar filament capping protein FliD [Rhodospirillum sp.]MCF8491686.1 flagellar filament capping protein FliD [Rhodospirillum sp.]MCF8501075.1 flagellar filament capping protein FliD [Rhodospirillum sp.]